MVNRKGRWYVAGQDLDRGEPRVFRLSRIDGEVAFAGPAGSVTVPPGTDVREMVSEWDHEPPVPSRTAVLRVREGAGPRLRRSATAVRADPEHPGWDLAELPFSDVGWFARPARLVRRRRGRAGADRPAGGRHPQAQGGAGVTTMRPVPRPATATDRLQRLLALLPYVVSRNTVGLAETAAAFGVTERQLVDDLNLLWCVELRSPDPYCPIDLSYEGGEIVVSEAEPTDRPLRLGVDEASALLVALRMLAEVPGLEDRSALSRTIAKLEAAAGEAAVASAQVAVQVDRPPGGHLLDQIRGALADGRRMHLSYYVPGRDEATERDVDPMRLLVVEGRTYLEGWCRRAEAVRLFRLDRVLGLTVLPDAAQVPAGAEPRDVDQGLFRPSDSDERVTVELTPNGRWVAEYYPCEEITELGEGRLRVTPAHPGHPLGAAAGAAARRRRGGDRAARAGRADPRRRGRGAGQLRLTGGAIRPAPWCRTTR